MYKICPQKGGVDPPPPTYAPAALLKATGVISGYVQRYRYHWVLYKGKRKTAPKQKLSKKLLYTQLVLCCNQMQEVVGRNRRIMELFFFQRRHFAFV